MVHSNVMAGAQQGVTFALKIKIKNKKVPQVGAQQQDKVRLYKLGRTFDKIVLVRGVSSFGRALPWHGRGDRFKSDTLHHSTPPSLRRI